MGKTLSERVRDLEDLWRSVEDEITAILRREARLSARIDTVERKVMRLHRHRGNSTDH
jgi:hypothetical protein